MSVIFSFFAKKWVIDELLAEFLAGIEEVQAIFNCHVFRAKVSNNSDRCT